MLLTLYKAIVEPVLLYAAPILLLASKSAVTYLETAQRSVLRYILGLPRDTPTALIHQEAQILPVGQLVLQKTALYTLRTATSPDPVQNITVVQNSLYKNREVNTGMVWTTKAAWLQEDLKIPALKPPRCKEPPPWEESPFEVHIHNPISKREDPLLAATEARNRILELNRNHSQATNIYTDASCQEDGKSGLGVYIQGLETELTQRLPDNTPITLAELHAIKEALNWINHQDNKQTAIIHSDSMAALTIINTTNFNTYPEVITDIVSIAISLQQRSNKIILNWIPSHVQIPGNDRADLLANQATKLQEIQHAEHSKGQFKGLITDHFRTQLKQLQVQNRELKQWYTDTTIPGLLFQTSRLLDSQLRKLRTWRLTKDYRSKPPGINKCPHCQQNYNPIHYLANCPAFPALRNKLYDHFSPVQHSWTDYQKAAQILRRATILPEEILPLITKDPYVFKFRPDP
jgi:ribonuclease HI